MQTDIEITMFDILTETLKGNTSDFTNLKRYYIERYCKLNRRKWQIYNLNWNCKIHTLILLCNFGEETANLSNFLFLVMCSFSFFFYSLEIKKGGYDVKVVVRQRKRKKDKKFPMKLIGPITQTSAILLPFSFMPAEGDWDMTSLWIFTTTLGSYYNNNWVYSRIFIRIEWLKYIMYNIWSKQKLLNSRVWWLELRGEFCMKEANREERKSH